MYSNERMSFYFPGHFAGFLYNTAWPDKGFSTPKRSWPRLACHWVGLLMSQASVSKDGWDGLSMLLFCAVNAHRPLKAPEMASGTFPSVEGGIKLRSWDRKGKGQGAKRKLPPIPSQGHSISHLHPPEVEATASSTQVPGAMVSTRFFPALGSHDSLPSANHAALEGCNFTGSSLSPLRTCLHWQNISSLGLHNSSREEFIFLKGGL